MHVVYRNIHIYLANLVYVIIIIIYEFIDEILLVALNSDRYAAK